MCVWLTWCGCEEQTGGSDITSSGGLGIEDRNILATTSYSFNDFCTTCAYILGKLIPVHFTDV